VRQDGFVMNDDEAGVNNYIDGYLTNDLTF